MADRRPRAGSRTEDDRRADATARREVGEAGAARLDDKWLLWRPVAAGFATFTEVRDTWSLHDLLDAHLVLDYREAADLALHPKGPTK